jgi:hypothetical protein
MDVRTVYDEAIPGIGRLQRLCDWSRFPTGQRPHGIEEVCKACQALCHGSAGLPVRCHRVTKGYPNAGRHQPCDEPCRYDLGRQGHQQHALPRRY